MVVSSCGPHFGEEAPLVGRHGSGTILFTYMKYSDEKVAEQLSGIKDYPRVNKAAIKEMHRQVGDLQIDEESDSTAQSNRVRCHI